MGKRGKVVTNTHKGHPQLKQMSVANFEARRREGVSPVRHASVVTFL